MLAALGRSSHVAIASLIVALGVSLAACHHHGGGQGTGVSITGLMTITVSPATATLTLDGTTPVSQSYTAQGKFMDGHTADITDDVAWTVVDATLGTFSGANFTSGVAHGGTTTVVATAGAITGVASLTIVFTQSYKDPNSMGLPSDPSASFSGAASTSDAVTPHLVYPNDGVVVPPNLGALEFHFTPSGDGSQAGANTLFELTFTNAATDIKVYLRCPTPPPYNDSAATPAALTVAHGCIYTPDATVWGWISQTNAGGDALTVSVRGTDDNMGAVGTSTSVHIRFTADSIEGAIYYWEVGADVPCVDITPPNGMTQGTCTPNTDTTAVVRYDFAGGDVDGTSFLTPSTPGGTQGNCVGCHALSHDGKKLIAEVNGGNDGRTLLWDVAMESAIVPFLSSDRSYFESWNPDGSQYVGVTDQSTDPSLDGTSGGDRCTMSAGTCDLNLRIYDGTTAKFVADVNGTSINNGLADHPDWSPDGNSIAYTLLGLANGQPQTNLQQVFDGSIYVVSKTGANWGTPVPVVIPPDDHTNYYFPAFSPDNSILVFDRAVCQPGAALDKTCWADSAPTSRLVASTPTMNATVVELANANKQGPLDMTADFTNSYPKWCPFVYTSGGEIPTRTMWLTFASKRHYGLRATPHVTSSDRNDDGDILWMAAINPDTVAAGKDGSSVAFALPFQRFYKSNHIAQWTTKIVPPVQ